MTLTFGTGFALIVGLAAIVEMLNIGLGLWSDQRSLRLRQPSKALSRRFPWSDRTGT